METWDIEARGLTKAFGSFTFPLDGGSIHSRQAWMAQDFETGCELKGLPLLRTYG